jgi:methylphosphotriester-DNA--protein-cysteine methyltransferase
MSRGGKFPIWKMEKLMEMVLLEFSLEDCAQALNVSAEVIEKGVQRTLRMSFAEWARILRKRQVKIARKAAKQGNSSARAWLKERNLLKEN